jgi:hypothetical protein
MPRSRILMSVRELSSRSDPVGGRVTIFLSTASSWELLLFAIEPMTAPWPWSAALGHRERALGEQGVMNGWH